MTVEPYDISQKDDTIKFSWDSPTGKTDGYVDIHNLANKCKKWAIKQNYIINSTIKYTFGYAQVEWYEKGHFDKHGKPKEFTFYSDWFQSENNNEPDAIFQATEFIIKNLRKINGNRKFTN